MFDDQFETFVADTRWSRTIHYSLRYQVYCSERRFENPAAFPDLQETDIYDKHAVHFIVRHRESRQWVGAMRLIFSVPAELPLTRFSTLDSELIGDLRGILVAEASRLCILPLVGQASTDKFTMEPRDLFQPSSVSLGLIRAAREFCLSHEIRFSFFLITDQLARILQRVGMDITTVGPAIEHRGLRRPYIHDNEEGYKRMPVKSPIVNEMFQKSPAYKYYSKIQNHQTALIRSPLFF